MFYFKQKELIALEILKENRDKIDKGLQKEVFNTLDFNDKSVFGIVDMEIDTMPVVIMFGYRKPLGKFIGHYDGEKIHDLCEFETHQKK